MYAADRKIRPISALASGAIVAGLALALVLGLRVDQIAEQAEALVAVAFPVERPPEPRPKPKPTPQTQQAAPEGDPAPRNLRNRATQVVAPKPKIELKPPPTVTTAPKADIGSAAQTGASDLPGPGQGAGGIGDGFGGGGQGGFGNGRGGGGPPVVGPRQIRGSLAYRDIPAELLPEGHGRIGLEVLFAVEPDGRVDDCRAVRSSGEPRIDAHVCRLIEQRFVYRPALDRDGRPVRSRVIEEHSWFGHPRGG